MSRKSGARRFLKSGGRKAGFYWDGLQVPSTNVTTAGVVNVIVDTTAQEFMPATVVSVRGFLNLTADGSDAANGRVRIAAKIMYVEVNDAQVMTGDHNAIDTHEEDIAQRQLWSYSSLLPANQSGGAAAFENVELNVKTSIRMEPHGKKLLVLLLQSDVANRARFALYSRVLLRYS